MLPTLPLRPFWRSDPVEAGRLALLDLLHLMDLVTPAKRTVCFEFHWHLHVVFTELTGY